MQAWAAGDDSAVAPLAAADPQADLEEARRRAILAAKGITSTYELPPLPAKKDKDPAAAPPAEESPTREAAAAMAGAHQARSLLRRRLDELDDLIVPLLSWLLLTNRAHLRPLRPSERLAGLGKGSHQFIMMSGPVERELKFQALRRRHGAMFAWHGSGSGNWHVILRTSLQNMSGSKHMSAGAAYGSGIYFAASADTSRGYCRDVRTGRVGRSWPKSIFGAELTCLALCEIVDKKEDFTYYPGKTGGEGVGNSAGAPRSNVCECARI